MRAASSVWSRDSTVHGPAISAKCSPPILPPPKCPPPRPAPAVAERGRPPVAPLGRRKPVGLEDRHDVVDALERLEAELGDPLVVLEVADRADDGHLCALADVRSRADALNTFGYGADVLLRGSRFHHDHHLAGPFGRSPFVGTLPSEVLRQKRG